MNKAKEMLIKVKEYFNEIKVKYKIYAKKDMSMYLKGKGLIIGAIALIIISTIILFASTITSKTELLNDLEIALKENNATKIDNYIEFDDKSISVKELQPLMEYYAKKGSRIEETLEKLRKKGESEIFSLKSKKKLFSEDYYLEVHPITLKINTNVKVTKKYLDQKLLKEDILKDVVPGIHKIKCQLETPYGDVVKEEEVLAISNEEVNVNLDAMNIDITSNFNDADVYINDKNTGKKVKDFKQFGPVPMNSDMKIYLQKELPWGTVKSDQVTVGNSPNININIKIENDTLIQNIKETSQKFYTSVFTALNEKNPDSIVLANKDTKDKIYNQIEKKAVFLRNNYEISELSTEIEDSEFTFQDNSYKANVVIKVNYTIYKKLLPFVKESHEGMFLTTMKYVGNEWLIEDIQKFNL